jgi:hypothetical protein
MARLTTLQAVLSYLNIGATIVLMVRLAWTRLMPVYRWFSLYLFADTLQQVLRLVFLRNRDRSAEIYMEGTTLKMLLGILVVLELYGLALAGQPALSRFGRNTVGYVLAAAGTLAAASTWLIDRPVPPRQSPTLYHFFSFERTMDVWLFIFLLIVTAFMTWFPVRLKRNVSCYIGGFVIYFCARSVGLFLQNFLAHESTPALGNAMLTVSFVCLLAWTLVLNRQGEETTVIVGHRWNPGEMQHLTDQLDAINQSLSRL